MKSKGFHWRELSVKFSAEEQQDMCEESKTRPAINWSRPLKMMSRSVTVAATVKLVRTILTDDSKRLYICELRKGGMSYNVMRVYDECGNRAGEESQHIHEVIQNVPPEKVTKWTIVRKSDGKIYSSDYVYDSEQEALKACKNEIYTVVQYTYEV